MNLVEESKAFFNSNVNYVSSLFYSLFSFLDSPNNLKFLEELAKVIDVFLISKSPDI